MKEYEYIVQAVEGYLCDELTALICSENYRNKSYDSGYRKIFERYQSLHRNFEENCEQFTNPVREAESAEEFKQRCLTFQQQVRRQFLEDILLCTPADIKGATEEYLKELRAEEFQTVAKRICLYPYLVSVLREHKKKEVGCHGKKI